ncbi:protein ANTAGONIST OF LIKE HETEROCHROMATIN PROTEIN 1-like [Harpegnathos saltator]|uniref:protein ANTAGONIST OF LIKE HETEROCHROMATIN PROTEIN 1-like n=1 Tax=Harpegnathos saltator TaxID=610380 RepID=UPI000590E78C|nr:protein ANTAGONIST OF LIKE HETEROCHROMATIN PROTEIN 1-like [Harpegnathos saltator]
MEQLKSQREIRILLYKINKWKSMPQLEYLKQKKRKKLIKVYLLYKILKNKEKKRSLRTVWVRPIFTEEKRYKQGASDNLIKEMKNVDTEKFFEYMRMDIDTFNELLKLIHKNIMKQNVVRTPISASTRLEICLRYLTSGDSMSSLSFAFRVGTSTVSNIVAETCQAIWNILKDIVFPECTEDMWIQKAKEFQDMWDFPNCIGAIDGKHVGLKAPPHSGSTFYNYKNMHSIVLMALADPNSFYSGRYWC